MRKTIKRIIIAAVILILAFILVTQFRGCGKSLSTIYKYESVARGEIKKTVSVSGKIEVFNSHVVLSKIEGLVNNVYVDYNQKVKKGQLLAKLDTSEIDQSISKMEAQMERVTLDLLSAKRELDAKKDLLKENLVSKRAVEFAELNYKKFATQLNQYRVEHKMIRNKKSYARIVSPSNGIVLSREIEANTPVNQRKVLFIIAEDLKKMRLILQVDESDIGYIKKGQDVKFTVSAFPEKTFSGKISQVRLNPITKSQGQIVSYESLVTCDNNKLLLKPGMTATATVVVYDKKDIIRVPNEAFIVSPVEVDIETIKKYVWRKKGLSMESLPVERIEVKTGITGDFYTEILSENLKEGDEILVGIEKKLEANKGIYDL